MRTINNCKHFHGVLYLDFITTSIFSLLPERIGGESLESHHCNSIDCNKRWLVCQEDVAAPISPPRIVSDLNSSVSMIWEKYKCIHQLNINWRKLHTIKEDKKHVVHRPECGRGASRGTENPRSGHLHCRPAGKLRQYLRIDQVSFQNTLAKLNFICILTFYWFDRHF